MTLKLQILLAAVPSLVAQSSISLTEAIGLGLQRNPAVEASIATKEAAQSRVREASSGFLPRVNYTESYQRSNNPVFVFGSLLTQHQFRQQNFDLGLLNRPDALNNFQSVLAFDQTIYDASSTKSRVRSADLGQQVATEDERGAGMGVIAGVARAYYGAVLAKRRLTVSQEAVRSAQADLSRAETVRAAGMSTDADVLSVRVHLAAMNEREIQARYALDVAAAALNDALGLPLETQHELSTPLSAAALKDIAPEALGRTAAQDRPETRQAALGVRVAEAQSSAARSALFPKISVHGALEADRQTLATRGGANWFFSTSLNWTLFSGFAAQSRRQETAHLADAARAQQKRTDSEVRLQVRRAYADWKSAQERIGVAAAAVSMAEEGLRITRNRYESGLTTITQLLRNHTAFLETKPRPP